MTLCQVSGEQLMKLINKTAAEGKLAPCQKESEAIRLGYTPPNQHGSGEGPRLRLLSSIYASP